jgi:periplasmic divalent cation tolerance protein
MIYITTKTNADARKISNDLLKMRLVACVNIIPRAESMYWWKGKIEKHGEAVIIAKTQGPLVGKTIEAVKAMHNYNVPDVSAIPIARGNNDYFKWISEVVGK